MKVKLFGPVMGLVVGLGIAIGCGGSSSSDVTSDTTDSGTSTPPGTPPGTPPPGSPDGSSPDGSTPDASDKDVFVPGTFVPVQYGSCPSANVSCGGNPVGTWTYSGGCLDAIDLSKCPSATITNPDIKVKGQVTFTGTASSGTVSRVAEVSIAADAFLPTSCLFGQSCATIQSVLTAQPPLGAGFDSASCTAHAGNTGCDCQIAKTQIDNGSEAYTVAGNVITTGTGQTARTYDFCIKPANTFTYQETTATAQQKATLVMTK